MELLVQAPRFGRLAPFCASLLQQILHCLRFAEKSDAVSCCSFLIACLASQGKRVLELGSGTGVSGVFLSRLHPSPSSVVLTDYSLAVLENLEYNLMANGVLISPSFIPESSIPIQASKEPRESAQAAHIRTCVLDWQSCEDLDDIGEVDLVLGADITFDPVLTCSLIPLIARLLARGAQRFPLAPFPSVCVCVCACGIYW